MKKLFKYSFFIFSFISAVLLLFCKIIPTVNPYEQSFIGILGLLTPLLVISNILFIFFWIFFKKYLFAFIPILALIISWNVYSVTIASNLFHSQNFAKKKNHFTLMSYNVRLLNLYQWNKDVKTRENILQLFTQYNPDVLCLQEFYSGNDSMGIDNIKAILNAGNYQYYASCAINTNKRGQWGSIIFSRFPIIKKINHDIDVYGSNMLQQADIICYNDTISFFNFHLKSNRFSSNETDIIFKNDQITLDKKIINQSKSIYKKLEKSAVNRGLEAELVSKIVSTSKYKTIVCGDLNDIPSSFVYFKLRKNMKDVFLENGFGLGVTYITKLPLLRIDYIFYNEPLILMGYKKIKVNYSDHYPLFVNFKI